MSGGQIIGLVSVVLLFGMPLIVGVVHAITSGWKSVAKHREDVDLKHKLVDAGFTAEEIVRIMNAGRKGKSGTPVDDNLGDTHLKVG